MRKPSRGGRWAVDLHPRVAAVQDLTPLDCCVLQNETTGKRNVHFVLKERLYRGTLAFQTERRRYILVTQGPNVILGHMIDANHYDVPNTVLEEYSCSSSAPWGVVTGVTCQGRAGRGGL